MTASQTRQRRYGSARTRSAKAREVGGVRGSGSAVRVHRRDWTLSVMLMLTGLMLGARGGSEPAKAQSADESLSKPVRQAIEKVEAVKVEKGAVLDKGRQQFLQDVLRKGRPGLRRAVAATISGGDPAAKTFHQLALRGHPGAIGHWGGALYLGRGVDKKDRARALSWLERGAAAAPYLAKIEALKKKIDAYDKAHGHPSRFASQ